MVDEEKGAVTFGIKQIFTRYDNLKGNEDIKRVMMTKKEGAEAKEKIGSLGIKNILTNEEAPYMKPEFEEHFQRVVQLEGGF